MKYDKTLHLDKYVSNFSGTAIFEKNHSFRWNVNSNFVGDRLLALEWMQTFVFVVFVSKGVDLFQQQQDFCERHEQNLRFVHEQKIEEGHQNNFFFSVGEDYSPPFSVGSLHNATIVKGRNGGGRLN